MSTGDPVFDVVRAIVDRIAGPSRAPIDASADTRLADGYWLDSIEMLEVLIACETTFGVAFDETHDFEHGALATLGALADLVRSKVSTPIEHR